MNFDYNDPFVFQRPSLQRLGNFWYYRQSDLARGTIGERYLSQYHRDNFCIALRTSRRQANKTIDQVSEHLGLKPTTIKNLERDGTPHHWTPRIEQFYGLEPNEIIRHSGFIFSSESYEECLMYWSHKLRFGWQGARPKIIRL